MAGHLMDTAFEQAQRVYDTDGIAPAMKARDFKEPSKIQETQGIFAGSLKSGSQYNQATQVLDSDGISPALTTTHPGIGLPKVKEPNIEVSGNLNIPGRYEHSLRVYGQEGIAPALTTASGGGLVPKIEIVGDLHLEKQGRGRNNHANDVIGVEGISTCLTAAMGEGGGHVPKIECTPIVTVVRKRAHEVDRERLVALLRDAKKDKELSNKDIASALGKPVTEVEHWFRTDDCGSIPEPECWMQLKSILGIETTDFDAPICEFSQEDNKYESAGRLYNPNGIAPTVTAMGAIKIGSEEPNGGGGNR